MAAKPRRKADAGPGNRPFSRLADLVKQAGIDKQPAGEPVRAISGAPAEIKAEPPSPEQEEKLFAQAMEGVARRAWRREPASASRPCPVLPADSGGEEQRLFQEAMSSDATPPILDHPEYIEGWIGLAGRRFLPNLRNGTYSIQGSIDLHGLGRIEARETVEDFIRSMSRGHSCCVKIIHGRGINSPSDKVILKEHLQRWLATRRMSRYVVAYASAPYTDGGVGAIYLLLRRSTG